MGSQCELPGDNIAYIRADLLPSGVMRVPGAPCAWCAFALETLLLTACVRVIAAGRDLYLGKNQISEVGAEVIPSGVA